MRPAANDYSASYGNNENRLLKFNIPILPGDNYGLTTSKNSLRIIATLLNPLRTVVAYMRQGNKLDYHAQTNRYYFAAHHPTDFKLLSFCSVYSAENSNVLGRT